ncbi:toxin-antitoxin system YwqK family antitoxin [Pseudomonas aeruginosa]
MKRLIGIILVALAITGCKSEIDNAETVIRNGLIYKYGEPDPFTGLVLNTPAGVPGISALCNSQVEKGRYSGKSECFYNSQKVYEVEYLEGVKNGTEKVFDAKTGDKISVKNWKRGNQDGIAEEYQNGVLTHLQEFKNGKPDGTETGWTGDGKKVITELTWSAGRKLSGYETNSNEKLNYLNGQLHGPQTKYGYLTGSLKQYVASEENYKDGKLDGVQKTYINTLHTEIIQQESEVIYENGTAVSGWLKTFNKQDGKPIQEIKLVQPDKVEDENFRTEYPGNLVPDGLIKTYNYQTDSFDGEEVWVNGVKTKYSYISLVATADDGYDAADDSDDAGDMVFNVLDTTAPYEKYRKVSKAEYTAHGASTALNPSATNAKSSSIVTSDNCLEAWISAFREEVGEDALIVSEQLSEWESWCSEGRLP